MKVKNLNFFEKHVEKVILGVSVLYFAFVMWFYVLGSPYHVKLPDSTEVAPQEVETQIKSEAKQVEAAISRPGLPFRELKVPQFTDDFKARLGRSLLPGVSLPLEVPMAYPGIEENSDGTGQPDKFVPPVPRPYEVVVRPGYGVLGASTDPNLDRAYTTLIGDQTPRDFRYVTVCVTFDLKQWRDRLADPSIPTSKRIPEDWWNSKLLVTNVTLQRQERNPVTGRWEPSPPDEVPPMPTQDPNYSHPPRSFTLQDYRAAYDDILNNTERIIHPDLPPMSVGVWVRPETSNNLTDDQKKKIAAIDEEISKLEATKRKALAPAVAPPAGRGHTGAAPASPPPPGPGAASPDAPPAAPAVDIAGIDQRIAVLKAQRAKIIAGPVAPVPAFDKFGRPLPAGGPPAPPPPTVMTVWAHDLTAKPGHVYQYRIVVDVFNPLFQHQDLSRIQLDQYSQKLSLSSEGSPWSAPVAIDPVFYYFFVGSDKSSYAANVEVYKIFNGAWTKQEFRVHPGDQIGQRTTIKSGGLQQEVDLNVGASMVDVETVKSSAQHLAGEVTRVTVYDPKANRLVTRIVQEDIASKDRQRISREAEERHNSTAAGSTGGKAVASSDN